MGRKKITKAAKASKAEEEHSEPEKSPEPEPEPEPQPEAPKSKKGGAKGKKESTGKLNVFSDTFHEKVDRFKQFYEDFLVIRGGTSDAEDELS